MEALSPVRLLPLLFWQGSNDDAHEREPDAEGLSQREAFPEDGKGEDKGEHRMRLPKRATMPASRCLRAKLKLRYHKEAHAEAI